MINPREWSRGEWMAILAYYGLVAITIFSSITDFHEFIVIVVAWGVVLPIWIISRDQRMNGDT